MDITNPLHEYRSYSYHHILCACKTTDAAESLSGELAPNIRKKIGAIQTPDRIEVENDIVVVINGLRDGEAFVKTASWENVFAPSSGQSERYRTTAMTLEGQMTIAEPKGFGLLECINNTSKALAADASNMIWVLKTIFVGYKADNTVDYISNIKPLIFMMYDMQAKFDVSGSEYYLTFVGVSNGSAKLPMYNSVSVVSLSSGAGSTLKDVIAELNTQLNANYGVEIAKLQERATQKDLDLVGRKIKYDIKLPEEYSEYLVDDIPVANRGNPDTSGNITFRKHSSIEQMIHTLLRTSNRINKDAAKSTGVVDKIFKTFNTISLDGDDVSGTLTITYHIKSYEVPKAKSEEELNSGKSRAIEYDYMYSGTNVDILDFDIKMEYGLGLLQMMTINNPLQPTDPVHGTESNTTESQDIETGGQRGNTANPDNTQKRTVNVGTLFPSAKFERIMSKGVVNNGDSAAFDVLLSKHSQFETLEAKVKVLGNPLVMGDINIKPSEIVSGKFKGESAFADWLNGPPLIKINVFIPANPNALVVEDKFRKQFWYKGFYQVISTKNIFDQGTFTQEHDMLSIGLEDPVVNTKPEGTK